LKRVFCLLLSVCLLTACGSHTQKETKPVGSVTTTPTDEVTSLISSTDTTELTATADETITKRTDGATTTTPVMATKTTGNTTKVQYSYWEQLFETEWYTFNQHITSESLPDNMIVYKDGRSFPRDDVQELIDNGTVTPEETWEVVEVTVEPKRIVSSEQLDGGSMVSLREDVTVKVVRGDNHDRIYPAYDFMGRFYVTPPPTEPYEYRYYFNVGQLQKLAKEAGADVTIRDEEQWLTIGDTKFISQSMVETCGIGLTVKHDETERVKEVVITLP